MRGREPAHRPRANSSSTPHHGGSLAIQPRAERAAVDELHRDEHLAVDGADVVHRDHVRMGRRAIACASRSRRIAPALTSRCRHARAAARAQELERDLAIELRIVAPRRRRPCRRRRSARARRSGRATVPRRKPVDFARDRRRTSRASRRASRPATGRRRWCCRPRDSQDSSGALEERHQCVYEPGVLEVGRVVATVDHHHRAIGMT